MKTLLRSVMMVLVLSFVTATIIGCGSDSLQSLTDPGSTQQAPGGNSGGDAGGDAGGSTASDGDS